MILYIKPYKLLGIDKQIHKECIFKKLIDEQKSNINIPTNNKIIECELYYKENNYKQFINKNTIFNQYIPKLKSKMSISEFALTYLLEYGFLSIDNEKILIMLDNESLLSKSGFWREIYITDNYEFKKCKNKKNIFRYYKRTKYFYR